MTDAFLILTLVVLETILVVCRPTLVVWPRTLVACTSALVVSEGYGRLHINFSRFTTRFDHLVPIGTRYAQL